MPMYVWVCPKCGKEVTVIRLVKDIEEEPSKEEGRCECGEKLERLMCAPSNRYRFLD